MAYMDLCDGQVVARFRYRTIAAGGFPSYGAASDYLDGLLKDLYESFDLDARQDNRCVVIWRTRPVIERQEEQTYIYARFATSPPIEESFWKKYEKLDGENIQDYRNNRV